MTTLGNDKNTSGNMVDHKLCHDSLLKSIIEGYVEGKIGREISIIILSLIYVINS